MRYSSWLDRFVGVLTIALLIPLVIKWIEALVQAMKGFE